MIRFSRLAALGLLSATGLLSGCITLPHRDMEPLSPVVPAQGEVIVVNDFYIVMDSSGSMHPPEKYRWEKDTVQSLALAVPDGSYDAQLMTFGGEWKMDWLNMPLAPFDRAKLKDNADRIKFIAGYTPLAEALDTLYPTISARGGHTAVLILSDGKTDPVASFESAKLLAAAHPGTICFHTVHFGCPEEGGVAELQRIAELSSGCGTWRNSAAVTTKEGIEALVRDIFFGPGSGAAMGGASWGTVYFDSGKAFLKPEAANALDAVAMRLKNDPTATVQLNGFCDARSEDRANQKLSESRVEAVKKALVERGVDAARITGAGHGETHPAAPNDTPQNMSLNRRVEIVATP